MCAQKLDQSDLQDVENKRTNQMDADIKEEMSEKKPFYYSNGWIALWSFLIWPIGLIMLWGYLSNIQKHEIPRTNIIKKDL